MSTSDPRPTLDQARIVDAAIAIADSEGSGALTMRALARSLGYEVMSLYNHVANKAQLQTLMSDAIAAEIPAPAPGDPPLAALRQQAIATRTVLARHPWAAQSWLRCLPGTHRARLMEDELRLLDGSGLSPAIAHLGYHAVTNHVLGFTLQEQAMADGALSSASMDDLAAAFLATLSIDTHPHTIAHVGQHLAGDTGSSFELVLDIILDGLVRLDRDQRRRMTPSISS